MSDSIQIHPVILNFINQSYLDYWKDLIVNISKVLDLKLNPDIFNLSVLIINHYRNHYKDQNQDQNQEDQEDRLNQIFEELHSLSNCVLIRKVAREKLDNLIIIIPKLKKLKLQDSINVRNQIKNPANDGDKFNDSIDNIIDFFDLLNRKFKILETHDEKLIMKFGKISDFKRLYKTQMSMQKPRLKLFSTVWKGRYGNFLTWNGTNALVNIYGIGTKSIHPNCEVEVYWSNEENSESE